MSTTSLFNQGRTEMFLLQPETTESFVSLTHGKVKPVSDLKITQTIIIEKQLNLQIDLYLLVIV